VPHYMLLLYMPAEGRPTPEESAAEMPKWVAFTEELKDKGVFVAGDALQGTEVATTVRSRDGELQVTDGPFAETREVLGGFYTLDVPDLDTALEYAGRVPNVHYGSIEVRPIWDTTEPRDGTAQVEAQA
jgi:hypothetical protein